MNNINSFTYKREYHNSFKSLNVEDKKIMQNSIDEFMFEDIEPTLEGTCKAIWDLLRPQLVISKNKSNLNQIETKSKPSRMNDIIYINIIKYLNNKLSSNYKYNTKSTINKITRLLEEEYKEEDFYKVIDKKYKEWIGTDMEVYLRPDTLFGSKFDTYLNQKEITKKDKPMEKVPEWFGKEIEDEKLPPEEEAKLKEMLSKYKD